MIKLLIKYSRVVHLEGLGDHLRSTVEAVSKIKQQTIGCSKSQSIRYLLVDTSCDTVEAISRFKTSTKKKNQT